MHDGLVVHHDGPVARITLDDEPKRNALGAEKMRALTAHLLSLIHISEPTRPAPLSRMPSSA